MSALEFFKDWVERRESLLNMVCECCYNSSQEGIFNLYFKHVAQRHVGMKECAFLLKYTVNWLFIELFCQLAFHWIILSIDSPLKYTVIWLSLDPLKLVGRKFVQRNHQGEKEFYASANAVCFNALPFHSAPTLCHSIQPQHYIHSI